jgi:flavin reductase (DIM6/NTAB) family NADH-FMN oxidoreductase RutF
VRGRGPTERFARFGVSNPDRTATPAGQSETTNQRIMDDPTTRASLRDVMAGFPTGVTIVAACDESGDPYGLTVNSFTSVSLEPPLVLVCIGHTSSSHDRLCAAGRFVINILSGAQGAVAWRFASEPSEGRFDDLGWSPSESGHPILDGAVAWLDCTVQDVLVSGDHSILVGRVETSDVCDLPALVFHRGRLRSTDP